MLVHAVLGTQYTRRDRAAVLRGHRPKQSKSQGGNGQDSATATGFFQVLKTERTKAKPYRTRQDARHDLCDRTGTDDTTERKHTNTRMSSPVDETQRRCKRQRAGV